MLRKIVKLLPYFAVLTALGYWLSNPLTEKGITSLIGEQHFHQNELYSIYEDSTVIFHEQIVTNESHRIGGIDEDDFYDFVSGLKDQPLYHYRSYELDTTGDGSMELVESKVAKTDMGYLITNTITRNGERIWEDDFLLEENMARWLTNNDDLYDNFEPYVQYYWASLIGRFAQKLPADQQSLAWKRQLLAHYSGYSDPEQLAELYDSDLAEYLYQYEGEFLFKMGLNKQEVYIWDQHQEGFVPLSTISA